MQLLESTNVSQRVSPAMNLVLSSGLVIQCSWLRRANVANLDAS
jgi:hypothetical protein